MSGSRYLTFGLAMLAVAVLVVIVVQILAGPPLGPEPLGTVGVPPMGEVEADMLDDGTPVFVTHGFDGTVTVVEAIATLRPYYPVGWCSSSRTIDAIGDGARHDTLGKWVSGPARSDLATYEYSTTDDGRLEIEQRFESGFVTQSELGVAGPLCAGTPHVYEVHPYWADS